VPTPCGMILEQSQQSRATGSIRRQHHVPTIQRRSAAAREFEDAARQLGTSLRQAIREILLTLVPFMSRTVAQRSSVGGGSTGGGSALSCGTRHRPNLHATPRAYGSVCYEVTEPDDHAILARSAAFERQGRRHRLWGLSLQAPREQQPGRSRPVPLTRRIFADCGREPHIGCQERSMGRVPGARQPRYDSARRCLA